MLRTKSLDLCPLYETRGHRLWPLVFNACILLYLSQSPRLTSVKNGRYYKRFAQTVLRSKPDVMAVQDPVPHSHFHCCSCALTMTMILLLSVLVSTQFSFKLTVNLLVRSCSILLVTSIGSMSSAKSQLQIDLQRWKWKCDGHGGFHV